MSAPSKLCIQRSAISHKQGQCRCGAAKHGGVQQGEAAGPLSLQCAYSAVGRRGSGLITLKLLGQQAGCLV